MLLQCSNKLLSLSLLILQNTKHRITLNMINEKPNFTFFFSTVLLLYGSISACTFSFFLLFFPLNLTLQSQTRCCWFINSQNRVIILGLSTHTHTIQPKCCARRTDKRQKQRPTITSLCFQTPFSSLGKRKAKKGLAITWGFSP